MISHLFRGIKDDGHNAEVYSGPILSTSSNTYP